MFIYVYITIYEVLLVKYLSHFIDTGAFALIWIYLVFTPTMLFTVYRFVFLYSRIFPRIDTIFGTSQVSFHPELEFLGFSVRPNQIWLLSSLEGTNAPYP